MIAKNDDSRRPEGATAATVVEGASLLPTVPEGRHPLPLGATPYTDENDPTDPEGAVPLSYDERRDWYGRGRYSVDCAPDLSCAAFVNHPDHGYFVDSELEPLDLSVRSALPDDQPVPQIGDPCPSCIGKPRVAGCVCAAMAVPHELVPQYGPASAEHLAYLRSLADEDRAKGIPDAEVARMDYFCEAVTVLRATTRPTGRVITPEEYGSMQTAYALGLTAAGFAARLANADRQGAR